ncbi:thymidine kinase [bacterium]|jgi:thymidine kinase|nr:thymidine kinase [bacterium]
MTTTQPPHRIVGLLKVVCGPMFSGKTELLLSLLRRAELARKKVLLIKNHVDTRNTEDFVVGHDGTKRTALLVKNNSGDFMEIIDAAQKVDVVGFDETQFFSKEIIGTIETLVLMGKSVIASGLDLDFRGVPFNSVAMLSSMADEIVKLSSVCMICGEEARFSQRIIDGKPANFHDPIILVGAEECYEPRCRSCFASRGPIMDGIIEKQI